MTDYRDDSYWVRKARRTAENAELKKRIAELETELSKWKNIADRNLGAWQRVDAQLDAVRNRINDMPDSGSGYDYWKAELQATLGEDK